MRSINEVINDVNAATDRSDTDMMFALAEEASTYQSYRGQQLHLMTSARAYLIRADFDAARSYLDRSLDLALSEGNASDEAKALSGIGTLFRYSGDYKSSLEYHHRALDASHRSQDDVGIAVYHYNIALVLLDLRQIEEAIVHIRMAIDIYGTSASPGRMSRAYGLLASILAEGGATDEALTWFYKALDLHNSTSDPLGRAQVIGNIATIYCDLERFDECLPLYTEAIQTLEKGGYNAQLAAMHDNMGTAYRRVGDVTLAARHIDRSIEINREIGSNSGLSIALHKKVSLLVHQQRISDARTLFQESKALHALSTILRLNWVLAESELLTAEGNTAYAYELLENALPELTSSNILRLKEDFHLALRDLALKHNDLAAYVQHNNAYTDAVEELRGRQATQRVTTLEANRKIEAELRERDKERALLYGALPKSVADRMIRGDDVTGDHFDHAAVMFLDIVGFTSNTAHLPPSDVVKMLENVFGTIDTICEQHNVIKIKTIGDSYMCFAHEGNGIEERTASPEQRVAEVALAVQQAEFYWPREAPHKDLHEDSHEVSLDRLTFRIGIHSGPVTAGVIGTQRLQYDVWGDTVNVASRMESSGEPGRIHVSEAFAQSLAPRVIPSVARNERGGERSERGEVSSNTSPPSPLSSLRGGTNSQFPIPYSLRERGVLEIKGKGKMMTFWLEGS